MLDAGFEVTVELSSNNQLDFKQAEDLRVWYDKIVQDTKGNKHEYPELTDDSDDALGQRVRALMIQRRNPLVCGVRYPVTYV